MLRRLGVSVARHRLISVLCWAVALAACAATALFGVTGESLFQRLSSAGPSVQGEAHTAADLIDGPSGQETESLSLLVHPTDLGSPDLAAILNSVRFGQIPPNAGLGLEMKVIAAVVVGGTAITGGRGTLAGTLLGVVLLGAIGPALTYLGVSAYWERAIQGAIILVAVGLNVLPSGARMFARSPRAARAIRALRSRSA